MEPKRTLLILVLLLGSSCSRSDVASQEVDLASAVAAYPGRARFGTNVVETYEERTFLPIWRTDGGLTRQAVAFRELLSRVDDHGLNPQRYGFARIEEIWKSRDPAQQAELDYLLTRALLTLVVDARYGRTEARVADGEPAEAEPEQRTSIRALEETAVRTASDPSGDIVAFVEAQFPQLGQYRKMQEALSAYRALARSGGWPLIPPGRAIKPGDTDPRLQLLAERLKASGDLNRESASSEIYDQSLKTAIESFQRRHGLSVDGVLGNKTVEALNVPVDDRIATIEANLERWRWLERDLGQRFVMVNLAGFELVLVDQMRVVFRTPVIIGKRFQRTPVFSSSLRYLEFNPYWNVPSSIENHEILPKLAKNPKYLSSQHMEFVNTDGHPRIRQNPGPWNALGAVKFVFPNRYDVYLHDTPTKNLFNESTRTFSHGCIRMKDPLILAEHLLGGKDSEWDTDRISEIVREGKNLRVPLPQPLPIHIVYRTAWVDLDGSVNFRDDVYGRDTQMYPALSLPVTTTNTPSKRQEREP